MIDVDAFHTRFTNRIVADYDADPALIVYDNLRGHSVSRGFAFSLNQNFARFPLRYTAGATVQDVRVMRDGVERAEIHSPSWKGVLGLTWTFARPALTLDWTGSFVGPMRLPEYEAPFERRTRSPAHSVHNRRAGLTLAGGVEIYAAANNLFDFTQGSPLVDPANPFGDAFDTTWVWGPGLCIGIRHCLPKPATGGTGRRCGAGNGPALRRSARDVRSRGLRLGSVHTRGDTTSLRSFAGGVLFINVWATWCAPCVAELASIERLRDSLGDAPVTFLIVSPEPVERVAAFVNRHGYRLPFHVERREMPDAFDLRALPTTYIVDANGQIVLRHRGAADWADDGVRAFLQHLVGSAGLDSAGPTARGTVAP